MELLKNVFLFLHLLGMAGIIAGWLMQLTASAKAPKAILHSSILQLVSGLVMVGIMEMGDDDVPHITITVKALVAVAVLVVAIMNTRNPRTVLANIAGALAVLNVAVAVFW